MLQEVTGCYIKLQKISILQCAFSRHYECIKVEQTGLYKILHQKPNSLCSNML